MLSFFNIMIDYGCHKWFSRMRLSNQGRDSELPILKEERNWLRVYWRDSGVIPTLEFGSSFVGYVEVDLSNTGFILAVRAHSKDAADKIISKLLLFLFRKPWIIAELQGCIFEIVEMAIEDCEIFLLHIPHRNQCLFKLLFTVIALYDGFGRQKAEVR